MPRYVAFLRGINVGGHRVTMDRLRGVFEALRLSRVSTFIASGNVVFDTRAADRAALERRIEARLEDALGYAVPAFVRTPAEIAAVVAFRPFAAAELDVPGHTLHVMFARDAFDDAASRRLAALRTELDEFRPQGRELYWLCRGRTTSSLVAPASLAKAAGRPVTARNMTMLRRLAAEHPPA